VSAEDRFVAMCFKSLNIKPLHTVDAQGRQRFLGMSPSFIGRFKGDHGFFNSIYAAWGESTAGGRAMILSRNRALPFTCFALTFS
jgi:hypothetical protein